MRLRPLQTRWMFGAALAAVSSSFAVAIASGCSDSATERDRFDEPDATPDSAANLPEAASDDANGDVRDAGFDRGPFDPKDEPVVCASTTTPCAMELVAGGKHFCARMSDGTVRCWGSDDFGALGAGRASGGGGGPKEKDDPDAGDAGKDAGSDGGKADAGPPTATKIVTGVDHVTQLSAAGATTCARIDDGRVLCWGGNEYGQLGLSTKATWDQNAHDVAAPVALASPAARIDVGPRSACALLASGDVWCWGNNESAQLARAGVIDGYVLGPAAASLPGVAPKAIVPGSSTMLAVSGTGKVVSLGAVGGADGVVCGRMASINPDPSPNGLVGIDGTSKLAVTASLFPGEADFLVPGAIGPGGPIPPGGGNKPNAHACAIHGGKVSCWGKSDRGALCTGFPDPELEPAAAPISAKGWAQQIAVGDEITCARLTDGTVQCCGDDSRGRLGTGVVGLYSAFFTPAAAFKHHAVQVATSHRSVCALVKDGTVECWGSNGHGELGTPDPDENPHPSPVKVQF